jgi:hypothetical protein
MPWPVGIHGIPRRLLIDADEFGLHLNDANRKYGSTPQGLHIRKPENYDRGTFKLTVILAIEAGDPEIPDGVIGSVTNPRVWARVTTKAGTSAMAYRLFVEHVLNMYDVVANPALHWTLTHDNVLCIGLPRCTRPCVSVGIVSFVVRRTGRRTVLSSMQ